MGVEHWWKIWHYALVIIGMLVLGSIYYFGLPLIAVYPVIIAAVITAFFDERKKKRSPPVIGRKGKKRGENI